MISVEDSNSRPHVPSTLQDALSILKEQLRVPDGFEESRPQPALESVSTAAACGMRGPGRFDFR